MTQPTALSARETILETVAHLEHLLPGQGPIRDFIHHNTLHGFQHYPFPQALAAAHQVTGHYGYLPATQFRTLLKEGRIRSEDLAAIINKDPQWAALEPIGPTNRGEIIHLAMAHDITPLSAPQLAWEINEKSALTTFRPGVTPQNRQRLLANTANTAAALEDLWQACLELFGHKHSSWYREDQLDRASAPPVDHEPAYDNATQLHLIRQIRHESNRLLQHLVDQVGTTLTLRGFLLSLTGRDILEDLRPSLLATLAAFLDLGMASWPLPERHQGFYGAWKACALADHSFGLAEIPGWRNTLAELPATAMEAVTDSLNKIGLPTARWGGYLERLALELPGWSGMVMWRSRHPHHQGMTIPVTMLDYLAVRLVLERLFATNLCHDLWLVEPTLQTISWYFHHHRAELLGRWSLFQSELPERLATHAEQLLHRPPGEASLVGEWQKLAFRIWAGRQTTSKKTVSDKGARNNAWPLFVLSQHLGLSGQHLRQGGPQQAKQMVACLNQLDDEQKGYLWLQAYEHHYQRQIFAALTANRGRGRWARRTTRPTAQVIFCMDDREEGIRRHLEEAAPTIETLGAAGFFGVPINWLGLEDTTPSPLCPVVVTPSHAIHEHPATVGDPLPQQRRQIRRHLKGLLFRESHRGLLLPTLLALAAGPLALATLAGKLLSPLTWGRMRTWLQEKFDGTVATTLTLTAPADAPPATPQSPRLGFTDLEQTQRVAGFLRTIGLTHGFAPLVVILGHGSSSQNNPHLAAYDCGACGGRHGGPNARIFAAMANRPEIRSRLREQGIPIPEDTWFIGGEHDTGNENITWYDQEQLPTRLQEPWTNFIAPLHIAQAGSAQERSRRLASAPRRPSPAAALTHMAKRGVDFSQARPELGHATNAVALIGRRSITQGVFFDRRMFLISYDPTLDPDGSIVEAILLAAGPVGAGINLEYYFSTVNPEGFGCGTKVVHNITGLLGVMEGTSSDLRTGLPRQMTEIHEAMRLLVVVEQHPDVLTAIYHRQPEISQLVGNAWIRLAAIDPDNGEIRLFHPATGWSLWENDGPPPPAVTHSAAWYSGHTGPRPPALIDQESHHGS